MTIDAEIKSFPAQVTDRHFIIDPARHTVAAQTMNLNLARFSDGADRFVFTIPGVAVDGHSLADCNSVMVHFENIGEDPEQRSIGIYPVEDLVVGAESATCSWLIRKEATAHTGALIFSVHFVRIADDGTEEYRLPTLTYYRVTVGPTVWNSETIAEEHPDIIAEFYNRIAALEDARGGFVRYDGPQELTPEEQAQAIANLGLEDHCSFAYNFMTVGIWSGNERDEKALDYIIHNWQVEPMSIYVHGWPVIGIVPEKRQFLCWYKSRTIQIFAYAYAPGLGAMLKPETQIVIPDETGIKKYIDNSKPLIVPIELVDETLNNFTTSVPFTDICEAFDAGRAVYATLFGFQAPMVGHDDEQATFCVNLGESVFVGVCLKDGTCHGREIYMATHPDLSEYPLDDYIVEQGTKDKWTYRKMASGTAECWKTVTATVATGDWSGDSSIASFGLFWLNIDKTIKLDYPFAFAEYPAETVDFANGTAWFPIQLIRTTTGSTTQTDAYRFLTYKQPEQDMKITMTFHVVGRWK